LSNNAKKGLMGFSRCTLFPIVKNDATGYEVGAKRDLPYAQSMTKEADTSEQKVYADDSLYLNVVNFNGLNVEITLAEIGLQDMADLGFGDYDESTKTLTWNPQGSNKEYGITFRCLMANGEYRMYRMYRFSISSITETETTTKGDSANVQSYVVKGNFSPRAYDDKMGEIHDGNDMAWLDEIPEAPTI